MLGFGRATPPLSVSGKHETVLAVLEAGLRQFYLPPALPNQASTHAWYFLHPVWALDTVSGQRVYDLPDDFGSLEGDPVWDATASTGVSKLVIVKEDRLARFRAGDEPASGIPRYGALTPKPATAVSGTRWQLEFERTANAAYKLWIRYHAVPSAISDSSPYPHGGAEHSETILASVKSAAEFHIESRHGVHHQKFLERLQASISLDNRKRPRRLGYSSDRGGLDEFAIEPESMPLYYNGTLVEA